MSPGLDELDRALPVIWEIAERYKLQPMTTHFEVIPQHIVNEIGAYGIPGRYSHWTHGQAYARQKSLHDYGLSKSYEIVINSDPSLAYLLDSNPPVVNKLVMAHVLGHTDFFKNNWLFKRTRRDMPHGVVASAGRIAAYEDMHGRAEVERFLDAALVMSLHVNPDLPDRQPPEQQVASWRENLEALRRPRRRGQFDDILGGAPGGVLTDVKLNIPLEPDHDVVGFIRDFAPDLDDWQRDILDVVRSESLYFWPQRRTKIMNEGWASYWHKRILREMASLGQLRQDEDEEWMRLHADVTRPRVDGLNPYHFGMKVFEWIEDYWNGRLTEAENRWLERMDLPRQPLYDGPLEESPALPKLREAMMVEDDQAFVRNHLNRITASRLGLFVYEERVVSDERRYVVTENGWQQIRDRLAASLNNCGIPYLEVVDGDFQGRRELYVRHAFEGTELDHAYLEMSLPYLRLLWGRTAHVETVVGGKKTLYSCVEGTEVSTRRL